MNESDDIVKTKYVKKKTPTNESRFSYVARKNWSDWCIKLYSAVEGVKAGKDVSYEKHLDKNVYITVCIRMVDIRHVWSPNADGK